MVGDDLPVVLCRLSGEAAPDLALIDAESNRPPWVANLFLEESKQSFARIFGARLGGRIIAFVVLHIVEDEAHILNFAVLRSARNQGVGRLLLEYALRECHFAGVRRATLEVRGSNAAAQGLYASCGFQLVAKRERYYSDDGEDALVYGVELANFAAERRLSSVSVYDY